MKHILTAAALLAASAALASAVTATFTDLSSSSTDNGISYANNTLTGDSLYSALQSSTNYPYYAVTATLVIDYTALTAALESNDTIYIFSYENDESSGTLGFAATSSGLVGTYNGSVYSSSSTVAYSYFTDTSGSYLTVTFVSNFSTSNGSRLYDSNGGYYTLSTALRAGSSSYTYAYVNSSYVLGISVTSGAVTDTSTIATTSTTLLAAVTAVPEPSSFGLLAGIGALALVAARRRRR